jgi:hypothetical protein
MGGAGVHEAGASDSRGVFPGRFPGAFRRRETTLASPCDDRRVRFQIARNPDPASKLPYLLRLPIGRGGLVLRARDTWPRTSRIFCYRTEPDEWPEAPDMVDDLPVVECVRRGVAIDLVVDRPRENRSQFVFTRLASGQPAIFWQSRKVVGTARPGARIPGRRASGIEQLEILVDTREHYPFRFAKQRATVVRQALPVGDYAICGAGGDVLAVVERKALADLTTSLNEGTLAFELGKLSEVPRAAVVVEDRFSALLKQAYAPTGFLPDMLARVAVRYPRVPVLFLETRPLAEEWTFRYLGAARAEADAEEDLDLLALDEALVPERS